jgi:AcrR family transcriptional regulator
MNTGQKIVDKALQLFNENGVEYVGMRELAAALDMRIGNITYYFPTKDDLVSRISDDLAALNAKTLVQMKEPRIAAFLDIIEQGFKNQLRYKCLFISSANIMLRNPGLAEAYKKTRAARNNVMLGNLTLLNEHKYLDIKTAVELEVLADALGLIVRFWIPGAITTYRDMSPARQMRHYIKVIAHLLLPHSTAKGRKELETYLE